MFIGIRDCLKIYDLLSMRIGSKKAMDIVERHVGKNELVYKKTPEGDIEGVMFFLQITDPYDIHFNGTTLKQSTTGKYLYIPYCYVRPEFRGANLGKSGTFWDLVRAAALQSPGVERLLFFRAKSDEPKRPHILGLKPQEVIHATSTRAH